MWIADHVLPAGKMVDVAVYRWGDVLAVMGERRPIPRPTVEGISSWRAAAKVLGISEDTLARHRKQHNDLLEEPWFKDPDAVVAWWQALHEARPLRRTRRA